MVMPVGTRPLLPEGWKMIIAVPVFVRPAGRLGVSVGIAILADASLLLSVGGFRGGEKLFRCNRSILKSFLPVCGLTYSGDLFQGGIEEREDVHMHEDLCSRAREAGRLFTL